MRKIAYVTGCFGTLSHTFMRREIKALKIQNWEVHLYGIHSDVSEMLDAEEHELIRGTHYLYPLDTLSVINAHLFFIFKYPKNYFNSLLGALFNEELNPFKHLKLIYHFYIAVAHAKIMKSQSVEHIHAHLLNVSATIAMYCAGLLDVSYSFTNHTGSPKHLPDMIGLKKKIRQSKFICTISQFSLNSLNEIYPCREKAYIVHCGVDVGKIRHVMDHVKLFCKERLNILGLGRMVEFKGFEYSLKAASVLKSKGIDFKWTFIGDGTLLKDFMAYSKREDLMDSVCFLGACPQTQVFKAFDTSDILVVSSIETKIGKMEGIPVTIMEALAKGVPVVATDSSGIPEIIKNEETGILVKSKDADSLASGIMKIATNEELRKKCIINGRIMIEKQFSIEKSADEMINLFRENL